MIVSSKNLLQKARKGGYAVGQFNTVNLETTLAILKTAEKLKSPVIIATSENEVGYSAPQTIVALVSAIAKNSKIPVAIHLDHGSNFNLIKECILAGYTSIHIDTSAKPFFQNALAVKKVVALCRPKGIQVEAELGQIPTPVRNQKVARQLYFTNSQEAADFVAKTGTDSLAISVGTAHGAYKGKTKIDFELLGEIGKKVKIPLVLHGGSLVPDAQIKKAVKLGISKVNVNTELRQAFTGAVRKELEAKPQEIVPYKILPAGITAVSKIVEGKIKLFGSQNKA